MDLTSLMMKNFIPAICAVVVTILLSTMLSKKQGVQVTENDLEQKEDKIYHHLSRQLQLPTGCFHRDRSVRLCTGTDKRISEEYARIRNATGTIAGIIKGFCITVRCCTYLKMKYAEHSYWHHRRFLRRADICRNTDKIRRVCIISRPWFMPR